MEKKWSCRKRRYGMNTRKVWIKNDWEEDSLENCIDRSYTQEAMEIIRLIFRGLTRTRKGKHPGVPLEKCFFLDRLNHPNHSQADTTTNIPNGAYYQSEREAHKAATGPRRMRWKSDRWWQRGMGRNGKKWNPARVSVISSEIPRVQELEKIPSQTRHRDLVARTRLSWVESVLGDLSMPVFPWVQYSGIHQFWGSCKEETDSMISGEEA